MKYLKLRVIVLTLGILLLYFIYGNYNFYDNGSGFVVLLTNASYEVLHGEYNPNHLLDLENFQYLIQPDSCSVLNDSITAIHIITSYAGNIEARSALRRAYSKSELANLGIIRVFLLASLKLGQSDVTQNALLDESHKFKDILQGNFFESYRNLTYKHTMGLKWVSYNCPHLKYIIKMDDDIIVDLYSLVDMLNKTGPFDLMGYVFRSMRPIRITANKWFVTREEFRGDKYPEFLSGWLYITRPEIAASISSQAETMPYFWIDDVFLTGVIAERLNIQLTNIQHLFTTHPEILDCCISQNVVCEFIVGPSGGKYDLQLFYQRHSKKCFFERTSCKVLSKNRGIETTCVAKRSYPSLRKGLPYIVSIKL